MKRPNECTDRGGRGCPCAWHARRKVYAREYARRQRAPKLVAQRMQSRTCPRRFGRFGTCGAVLVSETRDGRLVVRCPACERFERGICRDCPAAVAGTPRKARRCLRCKAKSLDAFQEKYRENNRAEVLKRARQRYQRDEDSRRRRNEYKRQWRAANPERVRAQKERSRGERRAEYQKAYREQHRVRIANAARATYHGVKPLRTCVACRRIVVTHRKKKCTRCKELARQQALRLLAEQRRSVA